MQIKMNDKSNTGISIREALEHVFTTAVSMVQYGNMVVDTEIRLQ